MCDFQGNLNESVDSINLNHRVVSTKQCYKNAVLRRGKECGIHEPLNFGSNIQFGSDISKSSCILDVIGMKKESRIRLMR